MPDLKQALRDFITTANSGRYTTEEELMSKFPELQGYDIQVLRDFITTANSGRYTDEETLFSKFPEFKFDQQQPVKQTTQPVMQLPLKKKEGSTLPSGIGTLESSGIKLTNVRKALGQEEEQQPIMMQRVRPETTAEADETWRRKPKFDFMPDFNKPVEEDRNLVERPAELGFIGRYTPERDKEKTPQFVEEALGSLTLDTFKKKSADSSKKELEYYLKDMGFKIEESAGSNYYTGRYVDVVSPRGERYPLYLGNDLVRQETLGFAGLASEEDIEGLKNFVRVETFSDPGIAKKQYLYEKENQKFKTKENIDTEVSKLSQDAEALKNEMNNFMANRVSIQEMVNKIEAYPENLKGSEQYNKLVEEYNKMLEDDKKASAELENKRQSIIANDNALKAAAGNYVKFREGQGSFQRAMWNKAMGGAGKVLSGLYDLQIEQSLNSGITGLIGNYIIGEEWDKILKAIKYGEYDGEKVLPFNPKESLRGIFTKLLGDTDVTEEYVSKIEREGNIVQRGILGLAESAPAMIGGPVSPVLMGAMVTDALDQEMMNDPDLKDLSEMEKMMIKAPIGIVSGILEKVGLKGALKGTALVKTLTGRAISKLPINATAAELRNATLNEIKNMGIKSSVALVGSALSEAETGLLQQGAEYGIKDIYNLAKGKKMFDTPEFFSQKYFNDIIDAALTEAVGGVVIGVPNSIAAAFKKDGFRGLDDETFKIFEQLAKDNDSRKFFVTDLKNKINSGQITGAQGKEIINAYDQAAGMIGTVDDEITDIESRKIAMDLISERKKLEAKRDKMDPGLAKPIQKRIDQINEQLSQITQDAIQKQAAGEVSLQPEAGAGQEVEIGGPEAKPKITPEESKRKEDLLAALEATDKDVIAIGDELLDRKEAQAELEAITQKEQAAVTEQGGMEQAEGLGTQLEMVAKEEQAPAKMTTTEVLTSTPTETKASVTFVAPDGNEVALEGNEQVAAQLYDEAVAVAEEQRTPEQNDIIQKMQPIVAAAPAVEVTPAEVTSATEVTPAEQFTEQDRARKAELEEAMRKADKRRKNITVGETTMPKAEAKAELDALNQKEQAAQQPAAAEVVPAEVAPVETRTAEQEADLLEELLTGKKKEPVAVEPTSKEAIAKRLRGKKNKGLMSSIDFGISQALYNGALEFMASQVEKDTKLGNAIANTIKWIDEKMQGKSWDKDGFAKYANTTFEEAETTAEAKEENPALANVNATAKELKGKSNLLSSLRDLIANVDRNVVIINGEKYKKDEIKKIIYDKISDEIGYEIDDIDIVDIQITGSRIYGTSRKNSDLDIILEYKGDISEDSLFNIVNDTPIKIDGVKVDINPIKAEKSGTISEQAKKERRYFDEIADEKYISKAYHSTKADSSNPELVQAVEEALGKPKGKKLSDTIRGLKIKGPGGLQSNILGIPVAIWNAGVETAAKAIEAGVVVSKAIQQGANDVKNWIKKNNPSLSLSDAKIKNKILIDLYENTIKIARENNVKTEGLITYFKRKGLSDAQIDVLLKDEKRKAEKPELSEETLPGYTKLMSRINDIIARGRRNGKTDDDIMKGVIANVESRSPEYANATDQQREQIIRDIRKMFGKKEKAAPSAEKITGKPKPKKVTVNEMTALKDQLRLEAKAAREAKGDLNAKRKMLAAAIKEMQKKGKITVRQAAVLINKVNSVNLDNPVMVERLLDYAEKVFNNAEFVEKMSRARKLLKTAKENVRTKIGVSKGLTTLMDKLFNINPNIIPDDVLESYLELVEMMGKRQAVLTLKEAAELTKDVEKILDAIDNELSVLDELIDIFDNYDDKVLDDNGKIDYAATIDKMLEAGVITASDAKLYKKYKDKVLPKEAREKKSEEQLAEEKKDLIDAVSQTQVDESKLGMREERDAARKLFDAMTPENLAGLTNAELANLLKVLDNINNGFFPHYAMKMTQKLNSVSRKATLGEAIANAGRLPITNLIANIKSLFPGAKTANMIMVIESPKYVLDQVFGFFKTSPIYDSVFKPLTQAFSSYKTDARKVKEKLDKAFNKVARSYMNNPAKIKMSQFKMMTYALQLEYNSNKDKGEGFYSAAEYIKETIKHAGSNQSTMSKKDKKLLGKVLEVYGIKDADGNFIDIDINKLYNSFNNAEKQALKTIQEVNLSLRDKAMFTAAVIHGGKIEPIDNYVSHNVLPTGVANKKISSVYDEMNTRMMPSTKAATLKERTEGVKPLNFNIFSATQRSANQVLMDFNLTEAVRTSRMVLNELGKDIMENGTEKQQSIFNAINDSFKTTLENTLMNTFNDSSFADKVIAMITKQAYRILLASVTRWTSELMSNLAYISNVGPLEYISGVTKYRKYAVSEKGPAILRNIDSAVQDRVYEDSVLSGRMIDSSIMDEAIGLEGTTSNYMVVNAMQTIYNNTLKKGQNFVAATADTLISTPDKAMMRPFYFGLFAKEFKKITGQDVNFDKISENDEAYLKKFKEAIEKSKDAADYHIMLAGGTKNPFASRQKAMTLKNATVSAQIYQSFNNFMNNFIIGEYIAARTGIYAMMGSGKINQRRGAAVLAGVVARMTSYTFLIKELGRGLAWLFLGDDDEEDEEKSIIEKAGQAFAGSMTSLILGRDFGNMTRSMINYGVEKVNENYVQDMMDGKYTKEDVIAYNSLIPSSLNTRPQFSDLMINMSGSGQPFLRSLKNLYENSFAAEAKGEDTIKKRENYWKYTLPLEAAGHLGFVPLYKDVRTITNKALQGEVNAIKEAKEEEKVGKAEAYGNYETLEEFEKKDPIKYDEYSAKGGKLYKYREDERKEFEEKNKDKPFFGHSEEKFKELYPKDWAKYYGPGTAYFKRQNSPAMLQKKAQEKIREAQLEQKRKIAAAKREQQEALKKALGK